LEGCRLARLPADWQAVNGEKVQPGNLIVAFSTNMPVERVALFCRSVRSVLDSRSTEIVIITDDPARLEPPLAPLDVRFHLTSCDWRPETRKPEKLLKRALLHGCRLFAASPLDRGIAGGAAARARSRLAEAWCHPLTARGFAYQAVLLERPATSRALLTDVKDVILQEDCFAGLDEQSVSVFEQSEPYGQARWDTQWVRQGFGRSAADSMAGTLPFNAGTILGGYRAMLAFLQRVTTLFGRYPFRAVDQAAINYLFHREGDGPGLVRRPNIREQVATIAGDAARRAVTIRDDRIVRTSDGTAIPIVHMWDRWPDLEAAVLRQFGSPVDEPVEEPPPSIFAPAGDRVDAPAWSEQRQTVEP
jgi:hypothetical protein